MPAQKLLALIPINKKSGSSGKITEAQIVEACHKQGYRTKIFKTKITDPIQKLRDLAENEKPDVVLACGGDGTVNLVATALQQTDIPILIIPTGSANGMAKELSLPAEPLKSLELLSTGKKKPIDLVEINKRHLCLHLADLGLNARIVKTFEKGPFRGFLGYGLAYLKTLFKRRKIRVKIETASETLTRETLMVVIANARKYGTGATINPEGEPGDGWFELVVVKKIPIRELVRMFFRFQRFDPVNIEIFSARKAWLTSKYPVHFQVDGEYLGKVKEIEATVKKQAVVMIVGEEEGL